MSEEVFCDGFGNIAVTGSLVRIELISMTEMDADGKPRYRNSQRVIMPLEAFLRSFSLTEDVVRRLTQAGIVSKKSDGSSDAVTSN